MAASFPFHELPTDMMAVIRSMSGPLMHTVLSLTCKAELVHRPLSVPMEWFMGRPVYRTGTALKRWRQGLIREAIALNYGVILRALLPRATNNWILEHAVATGRTEALEPLFDAGHFMTKKLVARYIADGNMAVLEVIIAAWQRRGSPTGRDCIWDESTLSDAYPRYWLICLNSRSPVLSVGTQFAIERGCPVSSYLVRVAIATNNHAFLRLVHKNGYRWRPREIHEAIKYSNMATIELLLSFGCPLDRHALGFVFGEANPRLPLIRLLFAHNCPFDEEYTRRNQGAYSNLRMDQILAQLRAPPPVQ